MVIMKQLSTLSLIAFLFCSCQTNAATGLFAGGMFGAGIGGISGGGKGLLIGGAAGMIAAGVMGVILDEQDRKVMEKSSPRTVDRIDRGDPLTINDVIKLSEGGINDDTIIHYMQESESAYQLSQAQVRRLQEAGVSERVIHHMIDSGY